MIRNTEFGRRLFHDPGQRRIVKVADLGEQMVLDLKVQTSGKPRHQSAVPCKVNRCDDLVNSPRVFDSLLGFWVLLKTSASEITSRFFYSQFRSELVFALRVLYFVAFSVWGRLWGRTRCRTY